MKISLKLIWKAIKKPLLILCSAIGCFSVVLLIFNLPNNSRYPIQQLFTVLFIVTVMWSLIRLVITWSSELLKKYKSRDDAAAKSVLTKINILRKIIVYFILFFAMAAIFTLFEPLKKIGIGLITSASFIGVITGLAAQKTLATAITGLQLALTQPIKIGDTVVVENELGNVEDITLSYIVVKLFDFRRIILPVHYFLEKPFQNWTRNENELIGIVKLYVDYTLPLDTLNKELIRILKHSKLWDGQLAAFYVNEFKDNILKLRLIVGTKNIDGSEELREEVREKLLKFIHEHYPHSLLNFDF